MAAIDALLRPADVREIARELGVTPRTAWRWRRRILSALLAGRPRVCSGVVDIAWMWRVSGQCRGMLLGIDDGGRVVAMPMPWPSGVPRLAATLQQHVASGSTIVAAGGVPHGFAQAVRRAGFDYRTSTTDGPALVRMRQISRWLRQFRGIDCHVIPAYLAWHELLSAVARQPATLSPPTPE